MKNLLTLLITLFSLSAAAQVQSSLPSGSVPYGTQYYIAPDGGVWIGTSSKKFRNIGTKSRIDSLLALKQGALTITTTGTSGASTLIGNTLNIPLYTGGGGGITSVTSSTADITVTNTTTAPVITSVVSGTGAGQLVRRGFAGGIDLSYISGIGFVPDNTTRAINYYSGTVGYGGHKFYVGGSTVLRAQIDVSGNWIVNNLATGGTAPATTGTTKMVVTDANGLFSFADIPGGSGGVTSFGKVDGLGINSSVANPTTTPVLTIAVDTAEITSREYLENRLSYVVKDFYADSTVSASTTPLLMYADTLKANLLSSNGDKMTMFVSGNLTSTVTADQYVKVFFGGASLFDLSLTPSITSTSPWELRVTLIRINSSTLRASATLTYSNGSPQVRTVYYNGSSFNFSTTNDFGIKGSQSSVGAGSLTANTGYIEFKPAAL